MRQHEALGPAAAAVVAVGWFLSTLCIASEPPGTPRLVSGAQQLKPGDTWTLQVEGLPRGARVAWDWDADLLTRQKGGDGSARITLRVKTRSFTEKRETWVMARVAEWNWTERASATIWEYSKSKPVQGDGKPSPPPAEGPLAKLPPEQRAMAELLRKSIHPDNPLPPQEFYSRLQAVCDEFGLQKPMVELNRVKTELNRLGLAEQYLGPKTELGGSKAEALLLGYRRDLTVEGIRYAIGEVLRQRGGNADSLGHVYLAKIGKWSKQNADAFTIAGDIDFTFLASDPATAMGLVQAFNEFVKRRIGMNMAQLDSVATAHGQAEHLVYVGPQGEKYGDDAMMELGRKPADIKNSGIELIDFLHPETAGSNEAAVSGMEALQMVLFESVIRDMPPNATLGDIDAEFERRWAEKRSKVVEPFLSMEMARHLEGDIIRQVDVFAALDVIKKGSKYLRRSNDIFKNDFKIEPADAAWTQFVRDVDDMAAGKWPDGKKDAPKPTPADIMREAVKFFESQEGLGKLFSLEDTANGNVELKAGVDGLSKFLAVAQQKIWDNVSKGFDFRIRLLNDLHSEPNEARRKSLVEESGRQLDELVKMLGAGLDAMQHEGSRIPDPIAEKARILLKLLETLPSTSKFKIPAEEIEKIRKLLAACEGNGNAQRLTLLGILDKVDRWVIEKSLIYSPDTPGLDAASARAGMFIDGVNSVLDFVDNATIQSLRDNGVIDFEYVTTNEDGKAEDRKINLITCETIAKINARLNESVLGRIGNSTAFKAFNLQQEASAYYNAVISAETPGEAFGNLATEFFRRRIPGGDAVEAAIMGDWTYASLKAVYVLFPVAAIPEALWGLSRTVQSVAVSAYWSSELESYVNEFYAAAEFKQQDPDTGKETEKWYLHAITHKQVKFERKALLSANCALLADDNFDVTLWANLAATDPFITLMEELENHEAAGQKVRDKFRSDLEARWQKVKTSFIKTTIEKLEARRTSASSDATGEADKVYEELVKIATELEIVDQVHDGIATKWDSGVLKALWVTVKNSKKWVFGQGLSETERNKWITVVRDYRDGYRLIRDAALKVEADLADWYSEAGLDAPESVQHGLRLLHGVAFLTGVLEEDGVTAQKWAGLPEAIHGAVEAELTSIKGKAVRGATLDAAIDQQYWARIAFEDVWIKALDGVGSRNPLWGARLGPLANGRREARAKLVAEFAALYGGVARALVINVRQKMTIKGSAGERPRVELVPLPAAEVLVTRDSGAVKVDREGESDFVARQIGSGKHSVRVSAKDFTTETGEEAFLREVEIPAEDSKEPIPAIPVILVPVGADGMDLPMAIDVRDGEGKEIPERPVRIGEDDFVSLIARVTERADSETLRFNWALGDKVLGDETSKSIRFGGRGLAGQSAPVTVVVIDAKGREGVGRVDIAVAAERGLEVRLGNCPPAVPVDGTVEFVVEAPSEDGMALTYQWFLCENGHWREGVQHRKRAWTVAPGPLVGEGGKIRAKVIVSDAMGHSGEAVTGDVVVGAPAKLSVEIVPGSSVIDETSSVVLRAQVDRFPDSGTLAFYWDEAEQPSALDRLEVRGADMKAAGQMDVMVSTVVRVVDQAGREGEASASVVCRKAKEPPDKDKKGKDGEKPMPPGGDPDLKKPADGEKKTGQDKKPKPPGDQGTDKPGDGGKPKPPGVDSGAPKPGGDGLSQSPAQGKPGDAAGTMGATVAVGEEGDKGMRLRGPVEILAGDMFDIEAILPEALVSRVVRVRWENEGQRRYTPEGKHDEQYLWATDMVGTSSVMEGPSALKARIQAGFPLKPAILLMKAEVNLRDQTPFGETTIKALLPIKVRPLAFAVAVPGNWKATLHDSRVAYMPYRDAIFAVNIERSDFQTDAGLSDASLTVALKRRNPYPDQELALAASELVHQRVPGSPIAFGDFQGFIQEGPTFMGRPQTDAIFVREYLEGRRGRHQITQSGGRMIGVVAQKGHYHIAVEGNTHCSVRDPNNEGAINAVVAQSTAAVAEMRAMIASLKLTPEGGIMPVAATDVPAPSPSPLAVKVSAATAQPRLGQTVEVTAEVTGGKPPYEFTWTGDPASSGEKVTFASKKPGEQKLSVMVKDASGATASGEVTIKVAALAAQIAGLPGQVIYGQKVEIRGTLEGIAGEGLGSQMPEFGFVWHTDKEGIAFSSPEGTSTSVLFGRMGEAKIWAQVLDKDGATIGETPQSSVTVMAPKFRIDFDPPAARVGQQIRARVTTDPMPLDAPVFYRWSEPASSNRMEYDDPASEIGFKVMEANPLQVVAVAEVPHYRDVIDRIEATFTPGAYAVKITVEEFETTKPKVWDPVKGGVKTLPRGTYAGDEQIRLRAEIHGEPQPAEVRWRWTVNEGTILTNDISQTPAVSRHETGSILATVEARDEDGVLLGTASIDLSVTVPPNRVNPVLVSAKPDKATVEPGETAWLRAEARGGTPPYAYRWSGAVQGLGQAIEFQGREAGDATAMVEVTDSKGRTGSAQVTVKVSAGQTPGSSTLSQEPGGGMIPATAPAETESWFSKQPWVTKFAESQPRGVTLSISAEPPDEDGWMSVDMRQNHSADSGFDPNVSPLAGVFRVSRDRQVIEWLEPVSGEFVPLDEFIRSRKLDGPPDAAQPPMSAPGLGGGDFESPSPAVAGRDAPRIVPEPGNPRNHVACIEGPDKMSFALPLRLPQGATEASISLRLLQPLSSRLIPFDDGRAPEGIRLRVRLVNKAGNSVIRDAVVRPTGEWRELEVSFYDLTSQEVALSIEAIWMQGPVYFDDVRLVQP